MKITKNNSEIPILEKTLFGLAGIGINMRIINEFSQETRDRIKVIRKSGLLLTNEYKKLDEIDNALLSVKIELQDYHPVPKEIEAALTERERN